MIVSYGGSEESIPLRTGTPIDILRGGEAHDIFEAKVYEKVSNQAKNSLVTLIAVNRFAFTRPSGRVTAVPKSEDEKGDKLVYASSLLVHTIAKEGRFFLLENPGQARLLKELEKLPNTRMLFLHNCVYGGMRRSTGCFLTNLPGAELYLTAKCTGKHDGICHTSGKAHQTLRRSQALQEGETLTLENDEEYPMGLSSCIALAVQHAARVRRDIREKSALDFTEIFSGPNALTTMEVGSLCIEPVRIDGSGSSTDKPEDPRVTRRPSDAEAKPEMRDVLVEDSTTILSTLMIQTKVEARASIENIGAQDRKSIGGMPPWKVVRESPELRKTGGMIRDVIENFITENEHLSICVDQMGNPKFWNVEAVAKTLACVDTLRGNLIRVMGGKTDVRATENCLWDAALVAAHTKAAEDHDTDLQSWIIEGAPVGIKRPIDYRGSSCLSSCWVGPCRV